MTFIDWSDPEEMLGLLSDYIADECADAAGERGEFLEDLASAVSSLTSSEMDVTDVVTELRAIYDSLPREFSRDPVVIHVSDCIAELEKLQ